MTDRRPAVPPPRPPPRLVDDTADAFVRWFPPVLALVVLLLVGGLFVAIAHRPPDPCDPFVLREGECPGHRPRLVIASGVPLCLCQGHPLPSSLHPETAP